MISVNPLVAIRAAAIMQFPFTKLLLDITSQLPFLCSVDHCAFFVNRIGVLLVSGTRIQWAKKFVLKSFAACVAILPSFRPFLRVWGQKVILLQERTLRA
jgi:hypothetical protein